MQLHKLSIILLLSSGSLAYASDFNPMTVSQFDTAIRTLEAKRNALEFSQLLDQGDFTCVAAHLERLVLKGDNGLAMYKESDSKNEFAPSRVKEQLKTKTAHLVNNKLNFRDPNASYMYLKSLLEMHIDQKARNEKKLANSNQPYPIIASEDCKAINMFNRSRKEYRINELRNVIAIQKTILEKAEKELKELSPKGFFSNWFNKQ